MYCVNSICSVYIDEKHLVCLFQMDKVLCFRENVLHPYLVHSLRKGLDSDAILEEILLRLWCVNTF